MTTRAAKWLYCNTEGEKKEIRSGLRKLEFRKKLRKDIRLS